MKPADERSPDPLIDQVFRDLDTGSDNPPSAQPQVDPELVAKVEHLLEPLDDWPAAEPAADLADRIIARVNQTSPLEIVASTAGLTPESVAPPARPRFPLSLFESLAVAACIALVAMYYLPGVANVRSQQLKAACRSQLASLYGGLRTYADANRGELPAVPQGINWIDEPNRRHLGPVVRMRLIDPRQLQCPAGEGVAGGDETGVADLDVDAVSRNPQRFLGRVNLRFYSLQNRNGPVPSMNQSLSLPLLADPNPMFREGKFDPTATNSLTHDGEGQNVLFFNGSTQFLKSPVVGTPADHIWRIEQIDTYQGTETPTSATDAFLIP